MGIQRAHKEARNSPKKMEHYTWKKKDRINKSVSKKVRPTEFLHGSLDISDSSYHRMYKVRILMGRGANSSLGKQARLRSFLLVIQTPRPGVLLLYV